MDSALVHEILSGDLDAEVPPGELFSLLRTWIEDKCRTERGISVPESAVVPVAWLTCEDLVWQLGEGLRQVLLKHDVLAHSEELVGFLSWVVSNLDAGKGREPFMGLAARYALETTRAQFARLLGDVEVQGHLVAALREWKIPGFSQDVRALLSSVRTKWIRVEAAKYLAWCEQVGTG
ncbi:MAG: hypothetical protein H6827_00010 [Planctomycetes bacterium]|nr:hypothetical protein [Planctomycetota bacterium]